MLELRSERNAVLKTSKEWKALQKSSIIILNIMFFFLRFKI